VRHRGYGAANLVELMDVTQPRARPGSASLLATATTRMANGIERVRKALGRGKNPNGVKKMSVGHRCHRKRGVMEIPKHAAPWSVAADPRRAPCRGLRCRRRPRPQAALRRAANGLSRPSIPDRVSDRPVGAVIISFAGRRTQWRKLTMACLEAGKPVPLRKRAAGLFPSAAGRPARGSGGSLR